jgi:hypothetical protein
MLTHLTLLFIDPGFIPLLLTPQSIPVMIPHSLHS